MAAGRSVGGLGAVLSTTLEASLGNMCTPRLQRTPGERELPMLQVKPDSNILA